MRREDLPTPCYIVDEARLTENAKILRGVADRTGAKVLLAQKAFSMFYAYPLLRQYLDGTTSSGLYEARLAHETFGGECHVFSAAYRAADMDELAAICGHVVFNSLAQLAAYRKRSSHRAANAVCVSIPNVPRRKGTRFTTRVRRVRGLA